MAVTGNEESPECRLDLGLVVDTTKSIGEKNIPFLKKFLKRTIQNLGVSQNGSHVSFETFAADSILHNAFNDTAFHSNEKMNGLIDRGINKLTQPTRLDLALSKADEEMFTTANGNRAGVSSVLLLLTDGRSHPRQTKDYSKAISSLKQKGVRIIVIAIGKLSEKKKYRKVLRRIAGDNIIYVKDYPSLKSVTHDVQAVICPPTPCKKAVGFDIVFLLDGTESVGLENYRFLKGFVLQIVNAMDIRPKGTHVAFARFTKYVTILNTFNDRAYYSNEAAHNLIENSPDELGTKTFIDRALEAANDKLFTKKGGSRAHVPKVLLLFTDGKTNPSSKPLEETVRKLKGKNIHIAVIGIGKNVIPEELEKIGDDVYYSDSFDSLVNFFPELLNETCSADGGFSRWSFWSECSAVCGQGVQTRTRNCTNPAPQGHGKDCVGDALETRTCFKTFCPPLEVVDDKSIGSKAVYWL